MRKRSPLLFVALLLSGQLCAAPERDSQTEVRATLQSYEAAWERHDAAAIASFYYEPAMRVSRGGPIVRPTRADQETFFAGLVHGLVDRGYARSEWEEVEVRLLDAQTAIASGITVRYKADGTLLERLGVTYWLREADGRWWIFLSATHAPEAALHFR
jgi:uncharacterized protein (TIGR02246 family)